MALVSFTSIQNGTSPEASQVNNPLTTIYNEFNGNITAANLASSAVTTPKLADASVTTNKLALGLQSSEVTANESTTSTSYVALTTAQAVTVTVPASGIVLLNFSCYARNTTGGAVMYAGCEISGANTVSLGGFQSTSNEGALLSASFTSLTFSRLITGLTPGSTTFTMKFGVSAGTGSFSGRRLSVIPLG